jgi:ADP-ribosylglycohydrolase
MKRSFASSARLASALGFLLGDMLGSPFEGFGHRAARDGYLKRIGSYTDDTLMYLSVLKAFKEKTPLAKTLVDFYDPVRGYGGRMDKMLSHRRCVATDSWGNGAATRTAALALFDKATQEDAVAYAKVTHTHPDAIKASRMVFLAVRAALSKSKDLNRCWLMLEEKKQLHQYSCGLHSLESIPPALIAYEGSSSFEEALRNAIALGGDTDSIGAVAGALAGAYYGIPRAYERYLLQEKKIVALIKRYSP